MSTLELQHVTKSFDGPPVVNDFSLTVAEGSFLALLGPSGCGKTTVLRIIAGLEKADSGTVLLDGRSIDATAVHRRNIGMVFQSYALFPHLSVFGNIAYGLEMRGVPKRQTAEAVRDALRMVRLEGYEGRKPGQLSGGQQQRVALARALVIKPRLLLLDESLSALDKRLREEMQVELRELQQRLGVTTVFVTHDKDEALTMADTVAVMQEGVIAQVGSPKEMYDRPRSAFVAQFLGDTNVLTGRVQESAGRYVLRLENGEALPLLGTPADDPRAVTASRTFSIRPEMINVLSLPPGAQHPASGDAAAAVEAPAAGNAAAAAVEADVVAATYTGNMTRYRVRAAGRDFLVTVQSTAGSEKLAPGARVRLAFPAAHIVPMTADAAPARGGGSEGNAGSDGSDGNASPGVHGRGADATVGV